MLRCRCTCPAAIYAMARTVRRLPETVPSRAQASACRLEKSAMLASRTESCSSTRSRIVRSLKFAAAAYPSGPHVGTSRVKACCPPAEERRHTAADLQHRAFAQSHNRTFVLFEVLADSFLARFGAVGRLRIGIEVVRVDLKIDGAEGGEGRRLDDR